jgi:hypothetical protein
VSIAEERSEDAVLASALRSNLGHGDRAVDRDHRARLQKPARPAAPASEPTLITRFEELDFKSTPMGDLFLRRRREPTLDVDVYEVKLGDEYLMSSLFTEAEEQLAQLGLAAVRAGALADVDALDVLVGGLGLGYTAAAALEDERVASMVVLEVLPAVIDWHERGLLSVSASLTADPRTSLELADFFAIMRAEPRERRWHAILVDIDHTRGTASIPATPTCTPSPGCAR